MWTSITRLVMLRTIRLSRSCGNCCHSCKIALLNSSICWHFGLRWWICRQIKSHTSSIGFMSGDIAGHGIVWAASCCKKCCTIRDLCGLALSSMNIGLSVNAWLANGGLRVEGANCHGIFGLSDYHQERTSPTYSQRKHNPRQLHPTPKSSCALNVVVLKWSVSFDPNPCTTVGRA